jgi:molybdenum cofactor cytidylyltransferase
LNIVGILLAAGSGSRFGGGKLLHALADGTPLGVASARNLRQALPSVVAVVRPGDDELARLLRAEGVEVVVCADAALGMGASLACGVRSAAKAQGWIVVLGDMPLIRAETIRAVETAIARGAAIAAPCYRGQRGHPVGFSAEFYPALSELRGDQGARSVLAHNSHRIVLLESDDDGICRDIDTRADAAGLERRQQGGEL